MIFFMANTSRRGLSLVTSLPGRLRIAPPTAGRSSCLVNSNTNLLRATYAASAALEGRGSTRLLVAPLSLAAARSGPGGNPNSSRSSSSSSSSSSSKRKLRHAPASTQGGATNSPGGARWRLSSDAAAVGGSPRAAGARKMAWGAGAGAGGRGWDQASSYGSPGGGRGGRGGPSRGLHDSRPYTPRPQSFGEIPEDQLQISFTRASGAGGQNVNKVSTKVEMRFVVLEAEWLPHDVRLRLARQEKGRINNKGELVITAQDFRTQKQNRSQALQKLREMINEAWEPAKERKMRTGIGKKGKEMRKRDKLHRSKVKAGRSKLSSRDFE
eukprot:g6546.t1